MFLAMAVTLRKIIMTSGAVLLTAGAVIGLVGANEYLRERNLWFYGTGSNEKAFLNATWRMSVNEVSRANGAQLRKPDLSLWGLFAPAVVDRKRFTEFIQRDISLWGETAEVTYRFFDNKLFQYLLALEGRDSLREAHTEITQTLDKRFGQSHPRPSERDDAIHSLAWESPDQRAEYWMLDLKKDGFFVGIEVTYLPGAAGIEAIVKGEKQKYF